MESDGPRPLIRELRARGEASKRELDDAGCERVTHWLTKLQEDGAVTHRKRRGTALWRLT